MDPGPPHRPPRRITGAAGLLAALRSWGLLGHAAPPGRNTRRFQPFCADDGQAIPVRVLGSGSAVVLIHGLGCSHRHWMPVARRLKRRHRVLAWDARGHGSCVAHPGGRLSLPRLANDLAQLLDHFEVRRPVLVGHSMGALTVMQHLAAHGTARVAAVVLVDQSPRIVTDDDWRLGLFGGCSEAMLRGLIAGARQDLGETIVRQVQAKGGGWWRRRLAADAALGRWLRIWLRKLDTAALLDLAESLALADFRPLLPTLDVPAWVVLGGRSGHYAGVPLDSYYRQAIRHASVSVYARWAIRRMSPSRPASRAT